tara:strand:- start:4860 stop:5108 length:249 start_codon:yes stop_codon:yes gene_type:complete
MNKPVTIYPKLLSALTGSLKILPLILSHHREISPIVCWDSFGINIPRDASKLYKIRKRKVIISTTRKILFSNNFKKNITLYI